MKVKDFVKLLDAASSDAEIKIENGEIVITDPKPIEYEFKVGDRVRIVNGCDEATYAITGQYVADGEPWYELSDGLDAWGKRTGPEKWLKLASQDITERIKTFEDACDVLGEINRLVQDYQELDAVDLDSPDILAYLKLRIITAALNEGWEPTYEMGETGELVEAIFVPDFGDEEVPVIRSTSVYGDSSAKLCFKSHELAIYAAKQFKDIYADFCGCKKGGKK